MFYNTFIACKDKKYNKTNKANNATKAIKAYTTARPKSTTSSRPTRHPPGFRYNNKNDINNNNDNNNNYNNNNYNNINLNNNNKKLKLG